MLDTNELTIFPINSTFTVHLLQSGHFFGKVQLLHEESRLKGLLAFEIIEIIMAVNYELNVVNEIISELV